MPGSREARMAVKVEAYKKKNQNQKNKGEIAHQLYLLNKSGEVAIDDAGVWKQNLPLFRASDSEAGLGVVHC